MKKMILRLMTASLIILSIPGTATAAEMLVPVGSVIGLEIHNNTVTVAAFEEGSCAQAAGLQEGDRLLSIDGRKITSAQDVKFALDRSSGTVNITVIRGETLHNLRIEPSVTADGPKLGVYLRQGITGIGTITYYDPDARTFGALGHGVNDSSGQLLRMTSGSAYAARIVSIQKGKAGQPGQLMGAMNTGVPLGSLNRNTAQGVFGTGAIPVTAPAMPVGSADSVKPGEATILSTVSGDCPKEYSVEILRIYPSDRQNGRNMLIHITDPTLLGATGGIVQGMGVSYNKDNQWNP